MRSWRCWMSSATVVQPRPAATSPHAPMQGHRAHRTRAWDISEAVALLTELAAQSQWIYGCFTYPAKYSRRARRLASDTLSAKHDDPNDFRVAYRRAAEHLRSTIPVLP